MILRFIFLGFILGSAQGYAEGRASAVEWFKRQAELYRGQPHDGYRRRTLNWAIDRFQSGCEVGRP